MYLSRPASVASTSHVSSPLQGNNGDAGSLLIFSSASFWKVMNLPRTRRIICRFPPIFRQSRRKLKWPRLLPTLLTFGKQIKSTLRHALSYCHRTPCSLQDYHLCVSTCRPTNEYQISALTHKRWLLHLFEGRHAPPITSSLSFVRTLSALHVKYMKDFGVLEPDWGTTVQEDTIVMQIGGMMGHGVV